MTKVRIKSSIETNTNNCVVIIIYGRSVDASGNSSGVSKYINNQTLVLNMFYNVTMKSMGLQRYLFNTGQNL
ncbi:MAG: hypothetical protein GKC53_02370 [Neisseriaceae bacterium]|nr:MAG: hypothetical protein GKC53_02370 [Neisseriaceae bacterium]